MEYKNIEWTKEDEEKLNKLQEESRFYLKLFFIGIVCGFLILGGLLLYKWLSFNIGMFLLKFGGILQ